MCLTAAYFTKYRLAFSSLQSFSRRRRAAGTRLLNRKDCLNERNGGYYEREKSDEHSILGYGPQGSSGAVER